MKAAAAAAAAAAATNSARLTVTSGAAPTPKRLRAMRIALLRWFDCHKRPLPWRDTSDPYRIWVAEVMLQQTRIAVVTSAYRNFLRLFPTLAALAEAPQDHVLSAWSGLGYYTRARCLHRAAQQLHARGEQFPRDYAGARQLPGVGDYTAAAVLSIAYGAAYAAVDGNITRVLSRLFCRALPDPKGEPHRSLAAALLDARRPGDWNQAVMELGETICTPRAPRCPVCPLQRWCAAYATDSIAQFPPARVRMRQESHDLQLHVVHDRGGSLLLERGRFAHLRHLWLPLTVDGQNDGSDTAQFKHTILHRRFAVRVQRSEVSTVQMRRLSRAAAGERQIFTPAALAAIGRSSLLTKALQVSGFTMCLA